MASTTTPAMSTTTSTTAHEHHTHDDVEKGARSSNDAPAVATVGEKGDVAAAAPKAPAMTFPEGGLQAWCCVAGSTLVLFSTFGLANAFGVYQEYYLQLLPGTTSSQISWIGSLQLFCQFFVGAIGGKLFDEGYFRIMTLAGSFMVIFSYFMLSLATKYYQVLLAQGLGIGIGFGLLFLPSISLPSHYFFKRRGLAIGICTAGSSIGGVIHPIMLNQLFPKLGFANGVRANAGLIAGCLLIAQPLMRTRLPSKKQRGPTPPPDMKRIFRDTANWFVIAAVCCIVLGIFLPIFYIQLFAVEHGVDPSIAFYSLAILNAASFFGRTIPNALADRLGPINILLASTAACSVLIWAWLGATSVGGMVVFSILYGFFSGAYVSLLAPVFISLSPSVHEIGVRLGFGFVLISVPALVGTPINGALLGDSFEWIKPTIFSAILVLVGTCFLACARHVTVKRKGTWKV